MTTLWIHILIQFKYVLLYIKMYLLYVINSEICFEKQCLSQDSPKFE